jgi:hypothetical protein
MPSQPAADLSLDEGWQVFVEQYPSVMQVYRKIARTEWFHSGRWAAFVGRYPHGIFMQLFKPHWFNQELDGIHFELALDSRCLRNHSASIQLHITHKSVLPDREAFNQYTIPRMAAIVSQWGSRYELSTTRLSERLNLNVPFTRTSFAPKVADEIAQVCQLGEVIDEALRVLWEIDR